MAKRLGNAVIPLLAAALVGQYSGAQILSTFVEKGHSIKGETSIVHVTLETYLSLMGIDEYDQSVKQFWRAAFENCGKIFWVSYE